jgi:ABC-type multidrug transport system ATPase subunit
MELGVATQAAVFADTLTVSVRGEKGRKVLLADVCLGIPPGTFSAVIGASGCGKSTLLRVLAGIQPVTTGRILLAGHCVDELQREFPLAVGYLPQFGAFHADLTVQEILSFAVALRLPSSVPVDVRRQWVDHIVELARLRPLLEQRYATLSGGQMRRIALAEELVGDPSFLFLDELTSGLDAHADLEMMQWLHSLAHQLQKTVVLVTHNTKNLRFCDSIIFLHRGRLVFHGDYDSLLRMHEAESVEALYAWHDQLDAEQIVLQDPVGSSPLSCAPTTPQPIKTAKPPGPVSQFMTLVRRQAMLLVRDRGTLALQLILLITFPALVAIFATEGLPQVRHLNLELESNIVRTLQDNLEYMQESFKAASLISSLVMFQVILLALMGANNGAREIAKEHPILGKELRAGLSPAAYVSTKGLLMLGFSLLQALWMTWFVKTMCGFPGDLVEQGGILFATTWAVSVSCLAISASSPSPERASLLAIYLVGLQLPLSGAVLALPEVLSWICRPFIATYWGWSGYLKTLESFRHYDVVKQSTDTLIAGYHLSLCVLGVHVLAAGLVAWLFVGRQAKQGGPS